MKKISCFLILFIAIFQIANAQAIIVKGVVKNEKGNPIPFALIQEKQVRSGLYTDSLGRFNITIDGNSTLMVSSQGYQNVEIKINNNSELQVVLKHGVNKDDGTAGKYSNINFTLDDAITGHTNFNPTYNSSNATQGGQAKFNGASFPIPKEKEATKGSRCIFGAWVSGSVVDTKNIEVNDPSYLFNYDKIGGNLLLTHDQQSAIEVNKNLIKSFTLIDKLNNEPYVFELVPDIDESHFVEVLSEGNKYRIYKVIKTKFVPASFTTNGLASSGNDYDEYTDENTYYLYSLKNKEFKKFSLKKKSIREVFGDDDSKLDNFFNSNNGSIDDHFLKSLGSFMNG